jgi:hypothetical protein
MPKPRLERRRNFRIARNVSPPSIRYAFRPLASAGARPCAGFRAACDFSCGRREFDSAMERPPPLEMKIYPPPPGPGLPTTP